jgi:hypothetical protein
MLVLEEMDAHIAFAMDRNRVSLMLYRGARSD